jgi:hypothetical protein
MTNEEFKITAASIAQSNQSEVTPEALLARILEIESKIATPATPATPAAPASFSAPQN